MKILITGGAGFIGSHVAEYFHRKAEVRIFDSLRSGKRENLRGLNVKFIKGDIRDHKALQRATKGVDYVFHLAAMISVPESMRQPQECVDINVTGTLNVLNAAAENKVKKLVLASSAAIYGNNPKIPKRESMLPEPQSPYAITKLDGEYYCGMFTREAGLATAALRFFNVFGPRQDPNSAYAAAIPAFIQQAMQGKPLSIYGNGRQTRDFIYVKDIVSGLLFAAMHKNVNGVFNCGYGNQTTINELAKSIVERCNSNSTIRYAPKRLGDVMHSRASVNKLKATGWKVTNNFEKGIAATVDYFLGL